MEIQSTISTLTMPVGSRDHILGPPTASVTLVEYGDFECPYCGMAHFVIKDIQKRLANDLRFVFRHFPLTEIHPHAEQAAEAAEAAGAQGKFWDMHDTLLENQRALEFADLLRYAGELDLDMPHFERDLAEHTFADRIVEDMMSGARSGVNGTPTFFINGRRHEGAFDEPTLLAAIEAARATKGTGSAHKHRRAA